jgi:hypothetical protein
MIHSRIVAIGLLAACATLTLSVASAAEPLGTLARIEGSTLINQGEQYVKAREGMTIKEGDRLIATEGSSAVIKFNDGCLFTLTDTQVLILGPKSTCAGGDAVASHPVDPKPAQIPAAGGAAAGGAAAAGAATPGWAAGIGGALGFTGAAATTAGLVVAGVAGTVAVAGAAAAASNSGSDNPQVPPPVPPQPISP